MQVSIRLLVSGALVTLLPLPAMAKQICGREILPFADMAASIKAEPGAEVARETASFVEIHDPKQLMIWTLVRPSGDQPAAYICRKIVQEDGQVKLNLSAECVGRTLNCDAVVGRILSEQNRATAPLRR